MSSPVPDALMGSSSVEAEAIAAVATIDMSVDNNQGAEDGEVPNLIEVRKEESRQREIRRETLRKSDCAPCRGRNVLDVQLPVDEIDLWVNV